MTIYQECKCGHDITYHIDNTGGCYAHSGPKGEHCECRKFTPVTLAELNTLRARVAELEANTKTFDEVYNQVNIYIIRAQAAEAENERLREMNVYLAALLRQVMNKFVDEEEGDCMFCEWEDGEHAEYCLGETIHDALGANAQAALAASAPETKPGEREA